MVRSSSPCQCQNECHFQFFIYFVEISGRIQFSDGWNSPLDLFRSLVIRTLAVIRTLSVSYIKTFFVHETNPRAFSKIILRIHCLIEAHVELYFMSATKAEQVYHTFFCICCTFKFTKFCIAADCKGSEGGYRAAKPSRSPRLGIFPCNFSIASVYPRPRSRSRSRWHFSSFGLKFASVLR